MLTNEAGDALGRVAAAQGVDALRDALTGYLRSRGIGMFTAAMIVEEAEGREVAWVHDASPDYFYFYQGGGHEPHDYGIRMHAECGASRPFRIGAAFEDALPDLRTDERRLYRGAAEWGQRAGMVLPNWSRTPGGTVPTGFSIWADEGGPTFDRLMADHGAEIALVLFAAQAKLLPPLMQALLGHDRLTARERECLTYAARGLRADAIADRLCLATVTVRVHLRAARAKLSATTLPEAVAKAVASGAIAP